MKRLWSTGSEKLGLFSVWTASWGTCTDFCKDGGAQTEEHWTEDERREFLWIKLSRVRQIPKAKSDSYFEKKCFSLIASERRNSGKATPLYGQIIMSQYYYRLETPRWSETPLEQQFYFRCIFASISRAEIQK